MMLAGCSDKNNSIPDWPFEDVSQYEKENQEKPRYIWIDASGNFDQFANNQENIKAELARLKEIGFTDVIVDVRPTSGDVLFKTSHAPELKKIDHWGANGYTFAERTASWDYLQTFIDEGHKVGLKVNAAINTFVGGKLCPYGLGTIGMLYSDSDKKDWATVLNTENGFVNTLDMDESGTKFLNPANDDVVNFLLNLLGDLAKYDLDGIVLDRCRFDDHDLMSDFSDISRQKFQEYVGYTIDDFAQVLPPGTEAFRSTRYVKDWLAFRAKTIHDFIEKASERVKSVNEKIRFGTYVGAWYSTYYLCGVNWASPRFNPATKYSTWASPKYKDYGYADHLDFIFLGAYASTDRVYGTGEWSMQGFCRQGGELLMGDVPYAGGPDIGNSTGWTEGGQAALIPDVVDACINASNGLFVFDLCHLRMYDYWDAFKLGIDNYLATLEKK